MRGRHRRRRTETSVDNDTPVPSHNVFLQAALVISASTRSSPVARKLEASPASSSNEMRVEGSQHLASTKITDYF